MTTKTDAIMSLNDVKAAIKANLGTPAANINAATTLAGQRFLAENAKGEFVTAVLLPELSAKGKLQATLACSVDGCGETHTREMSDWHQSMKCRTHSALTKVKLTDAEKLARKVARAQAVVDAAKAADAV